MSLEDLDAQAHLKDDLDEIERGGFSFGARIAGRSPWPDRPERLTQYAEPAGWRPPQPREKKPKAPQAPSVRKARAERPPKPPREPRTPQPRVRITRPPKAPRLPKPPAEPKVRPLRVKAPKPAPKAPRRGAAALPTPPRPLGRPPECDAPNALPEWYPSAWDEAMRRIADGQRQGQCLRCGLWKWADEPCTLATFRKPPKPAHAQMRPAQRYPTLELGMPDDILQHLDALNQKREDRRNEAKQKEDQAIMDAKAFEEEAFAFLRAEVYPRLEVYGERLKAQGHTVRLEARQYRPATERHLAAREVVLTVYLHNKVGKSPPYRADSTPSFGYRIDPGPAGLHNIYLFVSTMLPERGGSSGNKKTYRSLAELTPNEVDEQFLAFAKEIMR